jgi:hypothetical protein
MEQLGSHWTAFHEIWYLRILRKFDEKIQVSLKSGKNKGHFTWRPIRIFFIVSRSFYLRLRNFSDKIAEKIKAGISYLVTLFPKIVILWKNIVRRGRPQITIRRVRIACWISKSTNTYSGCVMLNAFEMQQWLHESPSVLCYTACIDSSNVAHFG